MLFNRFTGAYVTVSNYPGTTVEVSRGKARLAGDRHRGGGYAGHVLAVAHQRGGSGGAPPAAGGVPRQVLHVVDAKNLQRMLPMTLQLLEAGLPVVLAMNMMDESEELGFSFDIGALAERLGIPVQDTAGATNRGVPALIQLLGERLAEDTRHCLLGRLPPLRSYIRYDASHRGGDHAHHRAHRHARAITPRATALLLLQGDREMLERVRERVSPEVAEQVAAVTVAKRRRASRSH